MLGDLNFKKTGLSYCIRFEYSFHSSEYVYHLQSLFKYYILQDPKKEERTIKLLNKNSTQSKASLKSYNTVTLRFHTISLNLFDFLVDLFIRDGKKTIPVNLIKDHLTPVGLAYWSTLTLFYTLTFERTSPINLHFLFVKYFALTNPYD